MPFRLGSGFVLFLAPRCVWNLRDVEKYRVFAVKLIHFLEFVYAQVIGPQFRVFLCDKIV